MGNCTIQSNEIQDESNLSSRNFEFIELLGQGSFGQVWKAQRKKNRELYAIKIMEKQLILKRQHIRLVMNEKNILSQIRHPFLVNLIAAFQDKKRLYLALDLLTEGDLRSHLNYNRQYSYSNKEFFVACIIVALEYLHSQGIIHRDLKPENLVMDRRGYLRLTDFGLATFWKPNNCQDISGTLGYVAPEIMCKQNHGIAADYFALGVIAHECMLGKRPYKETDLNLMRDQMLTKQVQIKRSQLPVDWSIEAGDFINQLIQRKPENRLGALSPDEVKNHKWLRNFDWKKLQSKEMVSPYQPKKKFQPRTYNQQESTKQISNKNINDFQLQSIFQFKLLAQFEGYFFEAEQIKNTL
ncbi:unnamed protein product (macronuclear) [Paramecium tetraurelia]|uniref:non-specific serine/threonine protein kinase n=1 Tax=Paramecium tetraurelia TaxID=5888 RepID=A0DP63_PARTE|nr:uncharacterized protein GSPATT00019012001 [Paramecium tetraurelia]CAK84830.1 unnamed protein product [Paramecium tetraurelia]|eukprot:XP_001452227.1 hypothetical protein (macronuclear) [Paramecium tetraurelia strain d4-2]